MSKFQVIVGNIGTVYDGNNFMQASAAFNHYVKQSKSNSGRAAGESVTLFHNDDVRKEYFGTPQAFDCPLCGQHITDGKPCGCGAR